MDSDRCVLCASEVYCLCLRVCVPYLASCGCLHLSLFQAGDGTLQVLVDVLNIGESLPGWLLLAEANIVFVHGLVQSNVQVTQHSTGGNEHNPRAHTTMG